VVPQARLPDAGWLGWVVEEQGRRNQKEKRERNHAEEKEWECSGRCLPLEEAFSGFI
jgi:hypothetical protein